MQFLKQKAKKWNPKINKLKKSAQMTRSNNIHDESELKEN